MMVSSLIYYHVPLSIIITPWLGPWSRTFTIPQPCLARATGRVGSQLLETCNAITIAKQGCAHLHKIITAVYQWVALPWNSPFCPLPLHPPLNRSPGWFRRTSLWFTWGCLAGLYERGKNRHKVSLSWLKSKNYSPSFVHRTSVHWNCIFRWDNRKFRPVKDCILTSPLHDHICPPPLPLPQYSICSGALAAAAPSLQPQGK